MLLFEHHQAQFNTSASFILKKQERKGIRIRRIGEIDENLKEYKRIKQGGQKNTKLERKKEREREKENIPNDELQSS